MICPECRREHRRKEGMRCGCGYEFCLDPKSDYLTDGKARRAAERASGEGARFYTRNQWVASLTNTSGNLRKFALVVCFVLAAAAAAAYRSDWGGWMLLAGVSAFALLVGLFGTPLPTPKHARAAVEKYACAKGPPPRQLKDTRPLDRPPPEALEEDLFDYGVTGVLVCQRPVLVDLFVFNGFAGERGLLVMAEDGYPDHLRPRLEQVLSEQPGVPVYALHNADAAGEAMAGRLERSGTFLGRPVTDLGLSREQAKRTKRLRRFAAADGSVAIDHLGYDRLSAALSEAIEDGKLLTDALKSETGTVISFG